jgi:hypothetical protein
MAVRDRPVTWTDRGNPVVEAHNMRWVMNRDGAVFLRPKGRDSHPFQDRQQFHKMVDDVCDTLEHAIRQREEA